ncbi:hypothetical protein I541_5626 [Mycobacteroides abscessus]|nr:hypothetical protein I541_5626 [Mycobacteroides abscessus]
MRPRRCAGCVAGSARDIGIVLADGLSRARALDDRRRAAAAGIATGGFVGLRSAPHGHRDPGGSDGPWQGHPEPASATIPSVRDRIPTKPPVAMPAAAATPWSSSARGDNPSASTMPMSRPSAATHPAHRRGRTPEIGPAQVFDRSVARLVTK